MITPEYAVMMARYNAWENNQINDFIQVMDQEELTLDRGAFCGSILGTQNHILWGDAMWMSRFSDTVDAPASVTSIAETTGITADAAEWWSQRIEMDTVIRSWAAGLTKETLAGDLTWYSGVTGKHLSKPLALCVTHLFNHQTHHRGQVHAMLTAAGSKAPVSDIVFLPEDE